MILQFVKGNLLKVVNATPEEMGSAMSLLTEHVEKFKRNSKTWDGAVSYYWQIPNSEQAILAGEPPFYFYLPAGCWRRLCKLKEPDLRSYRPAYDVEFIDSDIFFNLDISYEQVSDFVDSLEPGRISVGDGFITDWHDQVTVLHSILYYHMSTHHIATGFGKTLLSYFLAQYTKHVYNGKTLIIVPRTILVSQGLSDVRHYQSHLSNEQQLRCYGIAGGIRNSVTLDDADLIIGTYQSLVNMPENFFDSITTVVSDEGHYSKATSVKEIIEFCKNSSIITAISGTMKYCSPLDMLTIEAYCGPLVSNYSASSQIDKGRLPRICIQPIQLIHDTSHALYYNALLESQRLPVPYHGHPQELSSTYRLTEFKYLASCKEMFDYILALCKQFTEQNKNILVLMTNVQPVINLFEYANEHNIKCHMILGGTNAKTRAEIRHQIENENGWIIVATSGTMSMGVSINNLHACIIMMEGKSPHTILQSIGRMFRKHEDKYDVTPVFDIHNKLPFGTAFDIKDYSQRKRYYADEGHTVLEEVKRLI